MPTAVRRYVRSLGLDAYVVGGAVRDELLGIEHDDEDFLVPGVDHAGLRAALSPHGRVEEMQVHHQLVGVRLHPHDLQIRALVPAGIELVPPRAERSTGPGHRDFEIVSGPSITLEEDMARRDFAVNAMALRLETGELVDPFGGLADLARRRLRTVTSHSFSEDPLRILRALRLLSRLGFHPAGETVAQMRLEAEGLRHVSAERIGGGLAADGLGELSRILLGRSPAEALRLARDTGVLVVVIGELAPAIGYHLASDRQPDSLDEHVLRVVQEAADRGASLEVRLAALLHDLGKPEADSSGRPHEEVGAEIAARVLRRLRYPVREQRAVTRIVRGHAFRVDGDLSGEEGRRRARRFLAAHGAATARELLVLKDADLAAKLVPPHELEAHALFARLVAGEECSATSLDRLAVDGSDLIAAGWREGPELGRVLHGLLEAVVEDPSLNERETLLGLARGQAA